MKTKNKELEEIIEKYDLVGKSDEQIEKIINDRMLDLEINSIKYLRGVRSFKILEYINIHYALPKSAITELSKDENVREILVKYGLVEEKETVKVGWKVNKTFPKFIGYWDGEKYLVGCDSKGTWCDDLSSVLFFKNDIDASPQEIESMLIKKLEADGLKVGIYIEDLDGDKGILEGGCWVYGKDFDRLYYGGFCVYEKGKFAKIIQAELTLEQRIERIEKELKL